MRGSKTVAIIGAGMSGLAAARLLCANGMTVQLFEANARVGGCCASTRLGGYLFNDGASYLAMPGMLDHLFHKLRLDRAELLPLRRISSVQTTRLPDGTVLRIDDGPDIAVDGTHGAAAAGDRIRTELAHFLAEWEPALRFFADDVLLHRLSMAHVIAKGWRHLVKLRGTVASQLNRSFGSEAARAAFAGTLLYNGVPPERMPALALLGLVAILRDGCFLPEGGMGRIPEVLSDAVRAQSGSIHLNANVRRILVKNGRAHAIDVENEGVVETDAVISSVSAMHTYGSLLSVDEAPPRMRRKLQRVALSHKGFVLQLGLSNKIAVRSYANYVLPWMGEQSRLFQPGEDALRWPIYMVPTVSSPELAPPGGSIVEMFPSISQDIAPDDWSRARKEEVAARAIERLRRDHELDISVQRILSPREFQNDAHLYAGALYGLSPAAGVRAFFQHRSPIQGLYQAGQTTWPGFGVVSAGLSGVFAAQALLHDAVR